MIPTSHDMHLLHRPDGRLARMLHKRKQHFHFHFLFPGPFEAQNPSLREGSMV